MTADEIQSAIRINYIAGQLCRDRGNKAFAEGDTKSEVYWDRREERLLEASRVLVKLERELKKKL